MKRLPILLGPLGLAAIAACSPSQYASNETTPAVYTSSISGTVPVNGMELKLAMRKLWEDHIVWTRNFIISAAGNLPDLEPVKQRLLRNQADIGNAIKPYYGDAAGEQLTALLRGHIAVAAELVTAAKANSSQVADINRRWQANGDSIATFLSTANPTSWPQETLRNEMRMHLDLTLREATARLGGNWAADIAAYDAVHDHIVRFSDTLSDGIIRQFPQRFASEATHQDRHAGSTHR